MATKKKPAKKPRPSKPAKKTATRKPTAKKTAAKKASVKKTAAKKPTRARKPAARKPAAKKRAAAKKPASTRATNPRAPRVRAHPMPVAPVAPRERFARLLHPFIHRTSIVSIALSPDGRRLATGSWVGEDYAAGGDIVIWDVERGTVINALLGVEGGVGWPDYARCLQWSPDGRWLGCAYNTNGVGVLDPNDREQYAETVNEAYVTDGSSRPVAFTWSPDSARLFVSSYRLLYDRAQGRYLDAPKHDVPGCILEVDQLGPMTPVWMEPGYPNSALRPGYTVPPDEDDEDNEEEESDDDARSNDLQPFDAVHWTPDGRILGTSGSRSVYCIDANTRTLRWRSEYTPPFALDPTFELYAQHPAGIALYNAHEGMPTRMLPMHLGAASLHFSPDGRRLVTLVEADNDYKAEPGVHVYSVDRANERCEFLFGLDETPARLGSFPGDRKKLALSPDGHRALLLTRSGEVQLWDLAKKPGRKLGALALRGAESVLYGARPIAWGPSHLYFLDASGDELRVTRAHALFETPEADAGLDPVFNGVVDRVPVGAQSSRSWALVFPSGVAVAPAEHHDELRSIVTTPGGEPANLTLFASLADAARDAPERLPPLVVQKYRDAARTPEEPAAKWPPREPNTLAALYELMEQSLAEAKSSTRVYWLNKLAAIHLYAGRDEQAEACLARANDGYYELATRVTDLLTVLARRALPLARSRLERAEKALRTRSGADVFADVLRAARVVYEALDGGDRDAAERHLREAMADREFQSDTVSHSFTRLAAMLGATSLYREQIASSVHSQHLLWVLSDAAERARGADSDGANALCEEAEANRFSSMSFDHLACVTHTLVALGQHARALEQLENFEGLSRSAPRAKMFVDWLARDRDAAVRALTALREGSDYPSERLALANVLATVDTATAAAWVEQDLDAAADAALNNGYYWSAVSDLADATRAAAHAGLYERAAQTASLGKDERIRAAALTAALSPAIEHEVRWEGYRVPDAVWTELAPRALREALASKEPGAVSRLIALARRQGDVALREQCLAATRGALDPSKAWEVGDMAAMLAAEGDYEAAYALVRRVPEANRRMALARIALPAAERGDVNVVHAVTSQLKVSPDGDGTGMRGFETLQSIRTLEGHPAWMRSLVF